MPGPLLFTKKYEIIAQLATSRTDAALFQIKMKDRIEIICGQPVHLYAVQSEGLAAHIHFPSVLRLKPPFAVGDGAAD
jgi:hypothetical protein